jgi:hypothetical protein
MQGRALKIRSKKKSFHQAHDSYDVDAQDYGRWSGTCLPVGTTTTLPCWRISKEGEQKWSIPPSVSAISSDKLGRVCLDLHGLVLYMQTHQQSYSHRLNHGYHSMLSAQRFETTTLLAEMRSSRLLLLLSDQSTLLI